MGSGERLQYWLKAATVILAGLKMKRILAVTTLLSCLSIATGAGHH